MRAFVDVRNVHEHVLGINTAYYKDKYDTWKAIIKTLHGITRLQRMQIRQIKFCIICFVFLCLICGNGERHKDVQKRAHTVQPKIIITPVSPAPRGRT